jgi:hypothetical protein
MISCSRHLMKVFDLHAFFSITAVASMAFLLGSCQEDRRALVVGKIQSAGDLVTTEFTVDKVVFGTKTKNLMWFKFNEAQFMAYSQAKVKTGIDLTKIQEKDIIISKDKIELILPPIEVINFSYPPSSFVEDSLISDPKVFLNRINLEDQEAFFRLAELDIRSNLQYMGLVKTSQDHTRQMFNLLLNSLGYQEIYIRFKNDELLIPQVNLLGTSEESK